MSAIAKPEILEKLTSPMEICWNWSYEIDIEKLRRLYSMAKRDQWDAEQHINWDREVDASNDILDAERMPMKTTKFWKTLSKTQQEDFTAHNAAFMLSQFLHGEQGALMVSAALVHAAPDYEAKLYAATQAMDEARHVEVFDRYIKKLDKIYPIDNFLKQLLDDTLTHPHWAGMLIGMQMIVEGLALGAFLNMSKATKEPLFKELIDYVIKDESRHVAYGNVYVKEAIGDMHADDREELEDFAFNSLAKMRKARFSGGAQNTMFGQVLIDSNIDPKDFMNGMMKEYMEGWRPKALPGQVHTFKDVMMPQLVQAGLVQSERIRKKYEEAKVEMYDHTAVLNDLQSGVFAELM